MTSTEKFILKEAGAKDAVVALLKIFDGKSYQFANAALNTAKKFLNEESQFKAENALQKIETIVATEKTVVAPKKKQ